MGLSSSSSPGEVPRLGNGNNKEQPVDINLDKFAILPNGMKAEG